MRDTRLVYVENDPALRGILTRWFEDAPGVELVLATGSPTQALTSTELLRADVALCDLALGVNELNGVELGLAMRERNPNIGIVVYSQYSLRNMAGRVPVEQAIGWSFVPKSGDMELDELIAVVRATAQGMSHDLAGDAALTFTPVVLDALTARQRAVIALAATGLTSPEIARRLDMSHDSVRKDLSQVYRLLVPDGEGSDLRTKAILVYLGLMQGLPQEEPRL